MWKLHGVVRTIVFIYFFFGDTKVRVLFPPLNSSCNKPTLVRFMFHRFVYELFSFLSNGDLNTVQIFIYVLSFHLLYLIIES